MSLSAIGLKIIKPLSRTAASKIVCCLCLDEEWGVQRAGVTSPPRRRVSTWGARHQECLNHQGIPESQLLSPAGMMCETCGFLHSRLLFPFLPSTHLFPLPSSFPGTAQWLSVVVVVMEGREGAGGERSAEWAVVAEAAATAAAAAACLPPTPSPVFLSCFLWDRRGVWL